MSRQITITKRPQPRISTGNIVDGLPEGATSTPPPGAPTTELGRCLGCGAIMVRNENNKYICSQGENCSRLRDDWNAIKGRKQLIKYLDKLDNAEEESARRQRQGYKTQ